MQTLSVIYSFTLLSLLFFSIVVLFLFLKYRRTGKIGFAIRSQSFAIATLTFAITSWLDDPIGNIFSILNGFFPSIPTFSFTITFWQLIVICFLLYFFLRWSDRIYSKMDANLHISNAENMIEYKNISYFHAPQFIFSNFESIEIPTSHSDANLITGDGFGITNLPFIDTWSNSIRFLVCEKFKLNDSNTVQNIHFNSFEDTSNSIEIFLMETNTQCNNKHKSLIDERINEKRHQDHSYRFEVVAKSDISFAQVKKQFPDAISECDLFSANYYMSEYLSRLDKFLKKPISEDGPPLSKTIVKVGCIENGKHHSSIEAFIGAWCKRKFDKQTVSLVGDYGQGKTTALIKSCIKLVIGSDKQHAIPIYARLSGMDLVGRSAHGLVAEWFADYKIDTQTATYLLSSGRAVFIFDGFDEIDLKGYNRRILPAFNRLFEICETYGVRMIIAGRPKFFDTIDEQRNALRIGNTNHTNIELKMLSPSQAIELFGKINKSSLGEFKARVNMMDPVFLDLVGRPILVTQMALNWTEISQKLLERGQFTSVVVRTFIDSIFRREYQESEIKLRISYLSEGEVRLVTYLAASLLSGRNSASEDELKTLLISTLDGMEEKITQSYSFNEEQAVSEPINRVSENESWIQASVRDFISRGIVEKDLFDNNKIRFSHKSFSEYVRAEVMVYELFAVAVDQKREILLKYYSRKSSERSDGIFATIEELDFMADLMAEMVRQYVLNGDVGKVISTFKLSGGVTLTDVLELLVGKLLLRTYNPLLEKQLINSVSVKSSIQEIEREIPTTNFVEKFMILNLRFAQTLRGELLKRAGRSLGQHYTKSNIRTIIVLMTAERLDGYNPDRPENDFSIEFLQSNWRNILLGDNWVHCHPTTVRNASLILTKHRMLRSINLNTLLAPTIHDAM